MVEFNTRGLVAPVFTPFHDDMAINYSVIPEYLNFLVRANFKSILVNGTTGEGMSQNVEERKKVAEAWVRAAKPLNVHVMVQVGGAPMPDVLELAKHAESIKAGSILTLPELYFKPRNIEELVRYIELVAKAAPNLPILYYHFPMHSGVDVDIPRFVAAAAKRVPNFRGLKCNLSEGAEVLYSGIQNVSVFLGSASVLAPAFSSGFDSSIATVFNMLPEISHEIVEASGENNLVKASQLQQKLNQFTDILISEGRWVVVMKTGMELMTGLKVGPPRLPQEPLTREQRGRLEVELKASGFIK